ncbi:MAG: hypothetical protein RLZZ210_1400 [Pseudomonadota bacterium]|jgi:hypothetical protein
MTQCSLCTNTNTKFQYDVTPNQVINKTDLTSLNQKLTNGEVSSSGSGVLYACNTHDTELKSILNQSKLQIFFTVKNI